LCFVLLRSEKLWNLPTKATQLDCILLPRSEKFQILQTNATQINRVLSFANKKQLKLIVFCSAKDFAIWQQKQLNW
jgi:hypothetical protein